MIVSGMSGNEVFCLAKKGFLPGEIVVGNSVCSLGLMGGLGAWGRGIAGGEVNNVTALISEGRHAAIDRMEKEAKKHGAVGVTSVVSELRTLAGYTEFLSQGTGVHGEAPGFFSTAASGMELYCQLDAGYQPMRFAMGNVAFALGLGRGIAGTVRTFGRGEVREFSQMYNHIRHLALERLEKEAAELGANAVVDIKVHLLPYGPGAVELLLTGTASKHAALGDRSQSKDVVTSELTGEELWNLAALGYVPQQLVMATSVYSLGIAAGIGTMFKGMARGELPELTALVYQARENCVDLLRKEAEGFGADQVIGNKLSIRELSPGLIEVMAVGTAVKKRQDMKPVTEVLIPQAIIVERDSLDEALSRSEGNMATYAQQRTIQAGHGAQQASGCVGAVVAIALTLLMGCGGILAAIVGEM